MNAITIVQNGRMACSIKVDDENLSAAIKFANSLGGEVTAPEVQEKPKKFKKSKPEFSEPDEIFDNE